MRIPVGNVGPFIVSRQEVIIKAQTASILKSVLGHAINMKLLYIMFNVTRVASSFSVQPQKKPLWLLSVFICQCFAAGPTQNVSLKCGS